MSGRNLAGWLVLINLATGACTDTGTDVLPEGDTPSAIDFTLQSTEYGSGDTMTLTLRNNSDQQLGYNLCFAVLERRVDAGWKAESEGNPVTTCPSMLRVLEPGGSAVELRPVSPTLGPGVYRFSDEISWPLDEAEVLITTDGFRIVP